MTHDEASLKLQKELGWTRTQADLHVSGSACLGMLKLDEPKSINERLAEALRSSFAFDTNVGEMAIFLGQLESQGLKIVEK